jgi:RNA polymerase sigma-70 factor, ECF subfamily
LNSYIIIGQKTNMFELFSKKKKVVEVDQALRNEYFDKLENIYPNLEKYIISLTRNRELSRDIINDSIIAGFDSYSKLRNKQAFLSYMFTIASRTYYSAIKKSKRISDEEFDFELICERESSPEDRTDIRMLYEAVDKLDPKDKELIILFDIIGLPYKDIAEVLKLSMSNVKVRLHRGRNKLAKILKIDNDKA